MIKEEFENFIGKQVSDKDYEVIDRLSAFLPAICEEEGMRQIASVYNVGGMALIRDMLETADIMNSLKKELEKVVVDCEKVLKIMGLN